MPHVNLPLVTPHRPEISVLGGGRSVRRTVLMSLVRPYLPHIPKI